MRDRMERFILLPFAMGCISDSSIAIGMQHAKRSKLDINSTPTRSLKGEEEEEEEKYSDDEESLSGQSMRSSLNLLAIPSLQKLFKNVKNFPQLFVYKDDDIESETGMEIGLPTDVKHVTHIGLDGCASSILSKSWKNHAEQGFPDLHSFPPKSLAFELAMATQAETPDVRNSLETKSRNCNEVINNEV